MTYSLRLPPGLDADARVYARRLGLSLNGLVCVALDQYLRERPGDAARAIAAIGVSEGAPLLGRRKDSIDDVFLEEEQRIEDARPKKQVSVLSGQELLARSKANLPMAKADRVALTAWMKAERKAGRPIA